MAAAARSGGLQHAHPAGGGSVRVRGPTVVSAVPGRICKPVFSLQWIATDTAVRRVSLRVSGGLAGNHRGRGLGRPLCGPAGRWWDRSRDSTKSGREVGLPGGRPAARRPARVRSDGRRHMPGGRSGLGIAVCHRPHGAAGVGGMHREAPVPFRRHPLPQPSHRRALPGAVDPSGTPPRPG